MTKTTMISPSDYDLQGNAVLVLPDKIPEKTRGGIAIPRTAKEKPQSGLVIRCGPACKMVKSGDRILYSRRTSSIVHINGEDYNFTSEDPSKIFYIYGTDENG